MYKQASVNVGFGNLSMTHSIDGGRRQIVMDEKFFLGYRKTVVTSQEVLVSVKLPFMQEVWIDIEQRKNLGLTKY
jgi:hypothetical protein